MVDFKNTFDDFMYFSDFLDWLTKPNIIDYKIYTKDYENVLNNLKTSCRKLKNTYDKASANTKKKKTKLSPPWYTLASKITELFKDDEGIEVFPLTEIKKEDSEGNSKSEYVIYIDTPDTDRAIALQKVLKTEYPFGNITVNIVIRVTNKKINKTVPVNKKVGAEPATYDDYLTAFVSTPAVDDVQRVRDVFGTEWTVIIFKKEVVQFYNDDLTDAFGNWNGLYTDIAEDVFKYNDHIKYGIAEE